MSKRRITTILVVLPTLGFTSAFASDVPNLPANPMEPVSWWTLLAFVLTWGAFIYGAYWTVQKNKATAEAAAQRQARTFFLQELDDEATKKKLADQRALWVHSEEGKRVLGAAITPVVSDKLHDALREHDDMPHAHAPALARYTSTEQFRGGMGKMEALIEGLRSQLQVAELRRADDMREVKQLIKDSDAERKEDFRDLRRNLSAIVNGGMAAEQ
jgi:hypothetical protein